MNKLTTCFALAAVSALSLNPALAADEHNIVPGLTSAGAPLALHGTDPVALIQLESRIDGSADYVASDDGVAYYFDSEKNRAAFEKNPGRYSPQFGGFCTFGTSVGKKFDGNPHYAAIENGKLYVFLNESVFREFQKDRKGTIAKAETNWKKIKHTAARQL